MNALIASPGPVEWLLGALLILRLVEYRRVGTTAAPVALFHGAWLALLVVLAIDDGAVDALWYVAAIALLAIRAVRMLRGARAVPIVATFAELLVVPLAVGLWPLALAGAALYALLLRFAAD